MKFRSFFTSKIIPQLRESDCLFKFSSDENDQCVIDKVNWVSYARQNQDDSVKFMQRIIKKMCKKEAEITFSTSLERGELIRFEFVSPR